VSIQPSAVALVCAFLSLSGFVRAENGTSQRQTRLGKSSVNETKRPQQAGPVVSNTSDSGPGSLRQALLDAQNGDTITFDISGNPNTISLTSGELVIDKNITVSGLGANVLTVSRDQNAAAFRIFHITPAHVATISGLTISNGVVPPEGLPTSSGGGIFNDHSALSVAQCVLSNNSAGYGGAICNSGSDSGSTTLTINNCTIADNMGGFGGAIDNDGESSGNAILIINDSTLSDNSCPTGWGGGIVNRGSFSGSATLTINKSTLSGNSANYDGGAIYNDESGGTTTLNVANSTVSGNTAFYGCCIYNYAKGGNGSVTLMNSTLADSLGLSGSVLVNYVGTLNLGNTIVYTYSRNGIPNIINDKGVFVSSGYNLVNDSGVLNINGGKGSLDATGDQINTNPMLGPLADNGGPTLTHKPVPGSPVIDKGKNLATDDNGVPALFDQRGRARPVRYDTGIPLPSGGDGSDIGALELGASESGWFQPMSAVSRKTHGPAGDLDINLPLNAASGIECRSGGVTNDYQIVVTFGSAVTISGNPQAQVTSGAGIVGTGGASNGGTTNVSGSTVTVPLTNIANAQTINVTLFGVSDGSITGNVVISMSRLLGDTSGNTVVNASDVSQTKGRVGQVVTSTNFRSDVNANGTITASDVGLVKSKIGTSLP
jgi:hypothetical protein